MSGLIHGRNAPVDCFCQLARHVPCAQSILQLCNLIQSSCIGNGCLQCAATSSAFETHSMIGKTRKRSFLFSRAIESLCSTRKLHVASLSAYADILCQLMCYETAQGLLSGNINSKIRTLQPLQ